MFLSDQHPSWMAVLAFGGPVTKMSDVFSSVRRDGSFCEGNGVSDVEWIGRLYIRPCRTLDR